MMINFLRSRSIGRHLASRGFSLVETIIVLVVLSIAATTVMMLSGNIFNSQSDNKTLQVSMKLMQECAEVVLATRRASGFNATSLASSAAATQSCSGITLAGYLAPTVTITPGNSPGIPACPTSTADSCKLVSITQGGLAPVTLLLVN